MCIGLTPGWLALLKQPAFCPQIERHMRKARRWPFPCRLPLSLSHGVVVDRRLVLDARVLAFQMMIEEAEHLSDIIKTREVCNIGRIRKLAVAMVPWTKEQPT